MCTITVPTWLAGPVALAWAIVAIAVISTLATWAARAVNTLPRALSAPIMIPAVVWHEFCHAIACVIAGHRIERIQLHSTATSTAHVSYRYNPNSFWQSVGTALAGWAPVLFSGALLIWGVPRIDGMQPTHQAMAWYAILLLSMAMPLSGADWRGAMSHIWLIVPIVALVGLFIAPAAMSVCAPMHAIVMPITAAAILLASIGAMAFLVGRVFR